MSSRDHNFRVGRLDVGGPLGLVQMRDQLLQRGFEGERGNRQGVRRVEFNEDQGLLYFIFIKEIESKITTLDAEFEDSEEWVYPRRSMKVILDQSGNYVYESVRGVSDLEAMRFVFEDSDVEVDEYQDLDRKTMLEFFNEQLTVVKRFKVEDIGTKEPNPGPIPDEIKEIVEEYGEIIDNSEHSVGREDKDAREDDLAYGIAETSDLHSVRGEDEDGRVEELTQTGIFRMRYDDEAMTAAEEARFVIRKISDVFRRIFDNNDD